jgi:NTE family protein
MARGQHPVVGLTLSGGGARGLAHIGVLKVIEERGLRVDCLSGASMGGILAACYAAGMSASELEEVALHMASLRRLIGLVDMRPPNRGLLAGHKVRSFFARYLPPQLTFAELRIPLALEAVDLYTGEEIALREGSVLDAALATSAFPGVLPPVRWNGRLLVDGGLLDNMPVDLARAMGADFVIAVNVTPQPDDPPDAEHEGAHSMPNFLETAWHAVGIMSAARLTTKMQAAAPDVLVHPALSSNMGVFSSFTRAAEIIARGRRAAEETLPHLAMLETAADIRAVA